MGNLFSEYEQWNTTSINICMASLLFRYDLMKYEKTNKIEPISIELYEILSKKMDDYLAWYKTNKKNNYIPTQGIQKMYSFYLISKVHKMNKTDKPINSIMKIWNSRDKIFANNNKKKYFRIEKKDLKSIPIGLEYIIYDYFFILILILYILTILIFYLNYYYL